MLIISICVASRIDEYSYSEDGKTLIKVTSGPSDLSISDNCEIISNSCFENLATLQSFSFNGNPNLKIIEKQGFSHCTGLKIINLSSCAKLTTISYRAFYQCSSVSKILLPKGLKEIQESAFYNNSIEDITIPSSVEKIGAFAFQDCSKLKIITFEESSNLTSLERGVFAGIHLDIFAIPENVQKISGYTFGNNRFSTFSIPSSNKYLKLENSIVYSKNQSILYFIKNKDTNTFDFLKNVTTLGEYCFYGSLLPSIKIPSSVKKIEDYAFCNSSYLKTVEFSGSFDFIGSNIFDGCDNLQYINFTNSSMIVDADSFISSNNKAKMKFTCKNLFSSKAIEIGTNVSVSYLGNQDLYIDKNALIMDFAQTTIYEYWGYNISGITIPESISAINSRVFENSTISYIRFAYKSKLSEIGEYAFKNCSNISTINFTTQNNFSIEPSTFENCIKLEIVFNIINISDRCFYGCSNLKNITIRDAATYIGVRSFENCCSLESITIPSGIKTISEYSFLNCSGLKSISFKSGRDLTNFSINSISECSSLQNISDFDSHKYKCMNNTIYYKNGTSGTELDLIYHLSHSRDEVLILNCNVIRNYSFNHSYNIVNISIVPNSVSLIESNSFNNCSNLKYINFPLSVQTVEVNAFFDCKSIQCPIRIMNRTIEYLKMINESGISLKLINSCKPTQNFDQEVIFSNRYIRR